MNTIVAWLEKHKLSTHTIGMIVAGVIASYQLNPGFHALVLSVEAKIPGWVMTLLVEFAWLYAWYRNGQKPPNGNGKGPGIVTGIMGSQRSKAAMLVVAAGLLIPSLTSCRHVNSNNPAVIKAVTLLDAEDTVNTISHGLAAANGTLETLQATEPDYYEYAHPKLVQIAELNEKANAAIVAAKNGDTSVDWKSKVTAVGKVVADPASLVTFGFKNPRSQQIVQDSFGILIGGISLAASYGGK